MKNLIYTFFSALVALSFLISCKNGNARLSETGGDTVRMDYARNLSMVEFDGYTVVKIRNPWDTALVLHEYILLPEGAEVPAAMSGKASVVRVPLKSSVVYSSVHNSLLCELGAGDAVAGVCDVRYIHLPELARRIEAGEVADCGNSMSPDIERMIQLMPGAILLSPFENSNGYGKLSQIGVPIVECADYMESSPLGRAEWMKFYGRLYGKSERADSLFNVTERDYLAVKALADSADFRPKVLMDRVYGGAWNVPGAYSTMGRFIEDAGGCNIFDGYKVSGSVGLAPEQVFYKAGDADVWLVRYAGEKEMTLRRLGEDNAIYRNLMPFKNKSVYGCNTAYRHFYEEVPFHPQWLLTELIELFHPELSADKTASRYFSRMDD